MAVLYELGVLGDPAPDKLAEIQAHVFDAALGLKLEIGPDISWALPGTAFSPLPHNASAALFFGGPNPSSAGLAHLLAQGVAIIPVVSALTNVSAEIPQELQHLNCMGLDQNSTVRIGNALLECAGLLRKQRHVFLSYRRTEARRAAVQLFEELAARNYDVFLDTHGVRPGEDFQARLWHKLCDSDVLVMLDTPTYFQSRWTDEEFGRAQAKRIGILRVGWPGVTPSPRVGAVRELQLHAADLTDPSGLLPDHVAVKICELVEFVRSQSQGVRRLNMNGAIRDAIELISGKMLGHGRHGIVHLQMPRGEDVAAYPALGVPSAATLHEAATCAQPGHAVVVYDSIGMHSEWLDHLRWLGKQVQNPKWIQLTEAAWQLAAWRA